MQAVYVLVLTSLVYMVDAEPKKYIDPKNHFLNDKYCVDLKCGEEQWGTVNNPLYNLDGMTKCSQGAQDNILNQLLENFEHSINTMQYYYNNTKNDVVCKQDKYRTLFMYLNIVWYRAKKIEQHVSTLGKQMTECFKPYLKKLYERQEGGNNCWVKQNHDSCKEKKDNEGSSESNNASGDDEDENSRDSSNSNGDDEDKNKVCGEPQNIPNTNATCVEMVWKATNLNSIILILEECTTKYPPATQSLKKNIIKLKDAVQYVADCYNYAENKNFVELQERRLQASEVMEAVKKDLSDGQIQPEIKDCLAPGFETARQLVKERESCDTNKEN